MGFPVPWIAALAAFAFGAPAALAQGNAVPLKEGNERFERGDYEAAVASYTRALQISPKDAGAYARRGRAYRKKGELDRAISDLDHAVGLDNRDRWIGRVDWLSTGTPLEARP